MNQKIKLLLEQKEVLYGTLLGDGWIETATKGKTYRFGFKQRQNQKQYVNHIYAILENLCASRPIINGTCVQFKTKTLACLRFYGHQFYGLKHEKKIPRLIHRWLTPGVLAYWYMDDGYKDKHHGAFLCTDCFTKPDVQRLCDAIKIKFQLNCWLRRKHKTSWRIYISSQNENTISFWSIIEPYVLSSMKYKLPNFKKT